VSERVTRLIDRGLCRMTKRAAVGAGLELKAHPQMLRHARGYAPLIQGGLGHRSITSTAIYTALARNSIQGFWRD
jgi:site-specific recombinase XerD